MTHRQQIAKALLGLAEYYDKQLTKNQIDMYVQDLSDLALEDLIRAVELYRKDARNDRFPLPAKLKGTIQPPDDQRARDAVGLVLTAVSRIGPYRDSDAREFIGELGWKVVKMQGGWEEVCNSLTNDNKPILSAQWRELAVSLINKTRIGIIDEKPGLEFKSKTAGLENLSFLVKKRE